jgi:peptidoglycan/LPS O-acetylase OafA/YrhL
MHRGVHRIQYLDGLRGIAIIVVVLTHFWGPGWGKLLPFGNEFNGIRIVRQGWVGVELFFLISGFVILLTVERCNGIADFLVRRWLRLFPAMLLVTLLTLLFNATLQPIAQFADDPWYYALPGLSFISSSFWHVLLRVDIESLHHAFWTLYVEVGFYAIFGVTYFYAGWKRATAVLIVLGLAVLFGRPALTYFDAPRLAGRALEPFEWLGLRYYPWFASGILFAKAKSLQDNRMFLLACVVGLGAAVLISPNDRPLEWDDRSAMIAVVALFAFAQRSQQVQQLLQARSLIFFGAISYPLYLAHETIGLGLIVLTSQFLPGVPAALLPVPTTVLIVGLSYWLARFAEPWTKSTLQKLLLNRDPRQPLAG